MLFIGSSLYAEIILGAKNSEAYLPQLKGKRVALVVNYASQVNGVHLVDQLLEQQINVVKIFAPEHGFRGKADAGEQIKDGKDKATGLPIVSLYGKHKKTNQSRFKECRHYCF